MALMLKRNPRLQSLGVKRIYNFLRRRQSAAMSTYDQKPQDTVYHESADHDAQNVWPDAQVSFDPYSQRKFPLPGNAGPPVLELFEPIIPPQTTGEENYVLDSKSQQQKQAEVFSQYLTQENTAQAQGEDQPISRKIDVELKVQDCPLLIRKDFQTLFPQYRVMSGDFTVVTICQKTKNDMSTWSENVDEEREALYKLYSETARELCQTLNNAGFWADYIDPCSGKPYIGPHTTDSLFETDERYRHFGFDIEDLGCCKIIKHHRWGSKTYVGSIFTSAPVDAPILVDLTEFADKY